MGVDVGGPDNVVEAGRTVSQLGWNDWLELEKDGLVRRVPDKEEEETYGQEGAVTGQLERTHCQTDPAAVIN